MADGKEKTQRRVYVLPSELVERINQFQLEKGFSSEVEAVRRLLDDSLKSRDTYKTLVERFLASYAEVRLLPEVAKEVLAGHPLVTRIEFRDDSISFGLRTGFQVTIKANKEWFVDDADGDTVAQSEQPRGYGTRGAGAPPRRPSEDLDDEIPF